MAATNTTHAVILVICTSLAAYNAIELLLLIFTTFNVYRGLYFWSMVLSTTAIIPYTVGCIVMYFDVSQLLFALIINNIGWIIMVVGQSVVLYSRLGVVLGKEHGRILKFTKWLIVVDAIVFYTLATVIVFGMHYSSNDSFRTGYRYIERLQMTAFCLQEFFISGLYIWRTLDILRAGEKKQAHRLLWQLFLINVVIVALDVALLAVEYLSLATIEISFKALAYSVKLKLEFAILSKLVEFSSLTRRNLSMTLSDPTFMDDLSRSQSVVRAPSSPTLVSSVHPAWTDIERSKMDHSDLQQKSSESIRTASNITEHSEQQLFQPQLSPLRSTPVRKQSDAYHDMIQVISRTTT